MTDVLTKQQRSFCMSRIKGANTKPELLVRKLVFAAGFRYRIHYGKLPGRPDMVFPGRRKVIFVHGCFWHSHSCKQGSVKPKTNADFWNSKRLATIKRDQKNLEDLIKMGWHVLTVWECETKDLVSLASKIQLFLSAQNSEE